MSRIGVVGAGIIGICTSFFLQKSGHEVTLFDHNEPGTSTSFGHACTFANYACIPVNSPNIYKELPKLLFKQNGPLAINFSYVVKNLPWCYDFLKNCTEKKVEYIASSLSNLLNHANETYDQIFSEVDVSKYIINSGALYLYNTEQDYINEKYSIDLRKKNGVQFKEVSTSEIKELEPNIAPVYYKGILFEESKYTTNPYKISKKIFETFISRGGNFVNKQVTNIKSKKSDISVYCDNSLNNFDKIVICSGAWSKKLAQMIGDEFPLDTERGYHVMFDKINNLINRPIGWSQSGFYIIPLEDGIRAAGTVEISGLKNKPNIKRTDMIEKEARKILPDLGAVKSTWIGYRPTLPDSLPIIDKSPLNQNIYYSFGHQHIGWTTGAISGKLVQYLIDSKKQNIDISAFRADRF